MGDCAGGGFQILEHTADVLIRAWGSTLDEALSHAVLGMYEVMTDLSSIRPSEMRVVEAEGVDLENLLYNLIEKLIILFDEEAFLISSVESCQLTQRDGAWHVVLEARGERYDPERHESRVLVKAATYHMMRIWSEEGCWFIQYVVDI
ncbi:MAG: archease [Thermofilum sp.]|uniref:Protein archease n=1 Tax=Thermofilum pendens TaxID=2269 RepID=A0A7C4D4S8_THEPE